MPENPVVAAFIAEQQLDVRARGVDALNNTSRAALKEQVHRLVGTFGTYQLDEAVAALQPLHQLLSTGTCLEGDVQREKATALQALAQTLDKRLGQE